MFYFDEENIMDDDIMNSEDETNVDSSEDMEEDEYIDDDGE